MNSLTRHQLTVVVKLETKYEILDRTRLVKKDIKRPSLQVA